MRRRVIIIDDDKGRSNWHQVNRKYLGLPDGVPATAVGELGDEECKEYGVRFLYGGATGARQGGDSERPIFTFHTARGPVSGRTVIFATGVSDKFPEFEG